MEWRCTRIFIPIATWIFLLNVLLFMYQLDEHLTNEFNKYSSSTGRKCKLLGDPLAVSALSRMRTQQCKLQLESFLYEMDSLEHWPVSEINNSCRQYYDPYKNNYQLGCYTDSPSNRLLKEYRFNFTTTNSPDLCIQNCLRAGFSYAGIEFGVECFCGGSQSDALLKDHRINDSHCQEYPCPGDNLRFCGGYEAIQIYRTGVQGKHTEHLPKFYEIESHQQAPVKILFLFQLNGRNSRQIRRLLRMIYSQKHLYFIHVDSRQNFMQLEMLKIQRDLAIKNLHNFRVMPQRMATIWGGTSLLELFLTAIAETMRETDPGWQHWDYMLNLSEADMPLLSLEELEYNLASAGAKSFLSSHGYNTANFLHKQGFNFHFMQCEERMWRVARRTNFPRNIHLDGGSDWVVVHRELAEFAISSAELPSQLRQLFSTILLPLESFFHTLALNSDKFCGTVLYRNLRFTNWRRQQGCRCSALKPTVDWCGCSPLALRAEEASAKLELEKCQKKNRFFGRKFDSQVDVDPVAFVERQALRFRPYLMPSSSQTSFNSTWVNVYSSEAPMDSPFSSKTGLLNAILNSYLSDLFNSTLLKECKFHQLLTITNFKANSTTAIQTVFTVQFECHPKTYGIIELLFDQFREKMNAESTTINTENGNFTFKHHEGISFGHEFDVKEEIFRANPPIFDTQSALTLLWRWDLEFDAEKDKAEAGARKKTNKNWTSPKMKLELYRPTGELKIVESIDPYDSVNGNQYAQFGKTVFHSEGTWKVLLIYKGPNGQGESLEVAKTQIPIFPTVESANQAEFSIKTIEHLLSRHFTVLAHCVVEQTANLIDIGKCSDQPWSSFFLDQKSIFP